MRGWDVRRADIALQLSFQAFVEAWTTRGFVFTSARPKRQKRRARMARKKRRG